MPTSYELRERAMYLTNVRATENAKLGDRQEGRQSYRRALKEPERLTTHIGWLLGGAYGRGAMLVAQEAAKDGRSNSEAQLGIMIAELDHGCPNAFARQAFRELDAEKQIELTVMIQGVVEDWKESEEEK